MCLISIVFGLGDQNNGVTTEQNRNELLRNIQKDLKYRGYKEGFYRFPRVDYKMLREAAEGGHIIVSSACLGGPLSYEVFRHFQDKGFDLLLLFCKLGVKEEQKRLIAYSFLPSFYSF